MSKKYVFIFPGQGSQCVGMGADLARDFVVAKDVFDEVDDALHQKLSALMFSGDLTELTQTQNAQPAIMAVSMAVFRVLQTQGALPPVAVAGHSLGEYTALCAAGVLGLSDTARLLKTRGEAMAKACEKEEGGMLALLGATPEQAFEISHKTGCFVANDNAVGQIVLSGTTESLNRAKEYATQMQIKRAVPLRVAGAFHSPLMKIAADEMAEVLKSISFQAPSVPVYFNVTAECDMAPDHYADLLTKQITAPVRWRELIQNIGSGDFLECGVGNILSGLVAHILPEAKTVSVGTSDSIRQLLSQ